MRILLVSDFYAPYLGGVEQHVRTLAHALAVQGHSVSVATQATTETEAAAASDGAVRVHRFRSTAQRLSRSYAQSARPWAPPVPDPGLSRGLFRLVRAERPDVIHVHDWMGRSALPAAVLLRVPLLTSLHYYTRSCAKKTLQRPDGACDGPGPVRCTLCTAEHYGPVKGPLTYLQNRIGSMVEDRVAAEAIAVSNATAAGNGLPSRRATVQIVPNMVPDEAPGEGEELPAGLPSEPFILYVGDLRREKGIYVLLEAYRRLHHPPPLVLVGERVPGSDIADVPGVVELGRIPNATVRRIWRRALVGVVPSVWSEPFGIVVLEAMSAGRTVVASRTGGLSEIIEDGRNGLLVEPDDAPALAAAITRLIQDPQLRSHLEAGAREDADKYTSGRVASQLASIYESAILERRARRRG